MKTVFEDQIRSGKHVYIIGASHQAKETLKYYLPHYTNKRVKKKIKLFALYSGRKHKSPVPLAAVRYLPEKYSTLVSTNVYGNKVAIFIWLAHDPVAIVIDQPDVAKTFRGYFDLLWKIGKA